MAEPDLKGLKSDRITFDGGYFSGGREYLGGVPVARIKAEALIGRKIERWELVHHIDGNARNNAYDNLLVLTRTQHRRLHAAMERQQNSRCGGTRK